MSREINDDILRANEMRFLCPDLMNDTFMQSQIAGKQGVLGETPWAV